MTYLILSYFLHFPCGFNQQIERKDVSMASLNPLSINASQSTQQEANSAVYHSGVR